MRLPALIAALLATVPGSVPAPTVTGPRETTSDRPVYRFSAKGAVGFRCAFDSLRLHRCAARYSELLATGRHVLRVRAVARDGTLSRVVALTVTVRTAPTLTSSSPISVGDGAGIPAAGADALWVPTTADGGLARLDPATRAVTARISPLRRPRWRRVARSTSPAGTSTPPRFRAATSGSAATFPQRSFESTL